MGAYKNFHRQLPGFSTTPITNPTIPPPESMHWFWAPSKVDIEFAPKWFMDKLHEMDRDLTITWDRYNEKWLVWMRQPKFQSKYSQGWMLLFPVRYEDGSYMPLDERVLARLYDASAQRWGRGRDYFLAIEREMERDKERAVKSHRDDTGHAAGEYYDYMKIKNIGSGSKFANHFSG